MLRWRCSSSRLCRASLCLAIRGESNSVKYAKRQISTVVSRCFSSNTSSSHTNDTHTNTHAHESLPFRGTAREELQDLLRLRRYDDREIRSAFESMRETRTAAAEHQTNTHTFRADNDDDINNSNNSKEKDKIDVLSGLRRLVCEKERHLAAINATHTQTQKQTHAHAHAHARPLSERDIDAQAHSLHATLLGNAPNKLFSIAGGMTHTSTNNNTKVNINQITSSPAGDIHSNTGTNYGSFTSNNHPTTGNTAQTMTLSEFKHLVRRFGERLDARVYSVALSYLCVGLSVGVTVPCMTMLVSELSLSPSTFGLAVSAFALSKLLGNIPAAKYVENHGRKPVMLGGILLSGASLAAVSLVFVPGFGAEWLILCRFLGGFGVAGLVSGGNMFMSDVSTALNRTRTIAPVMVSFSAGTALGPALGGVLVENLGLSLSYLAVGGAYAAIALLGQWTIPETAVARMTVLCNARARIEQHERSTQHKKDTSEDSFTQRISSTLLSVRTALNTTTHLFSEAVKKWQAMMHATPMLRDVVAYQVASHLALSGTQMTLLPLFLASSSYSAADIATCFAVQSIGSLLAAQPVAIVADKIGKHRVLALGGALLSLSALAIPHTSSLPALLAAITPMSIASACLSAPPTAIVSDLSRESERAQAMSLLRTAGDLGLLSGAAVAGWIGTYASLEAAFCSDAALMAAAAIWFGKKYMGMKSIPTNNIKS